MKVMALCLVCAVGAFAVMTLHLTGQLGSADEYAPELVEKQAAPAAAFPDVLAPAAKGEAIPQAAEFHPRAPEHPAVVLDRHGRLHPWYKRLQPDWQAETVEATEVVVVLAPQVKTLLQIQTYPNGAPPVRRYRYDLDAWLVEAKTGKQIASKRFTTTARPIRPVEPWELTELGDPVEWAVVSEWMRDELSDYPPPAPPEGH
jgi:hypothetical protein